MVYKPTQSEANVAKKDPHGLKYQPIPSENRNSKATVINALDSF